MAGRVLHGTRRIDKPGQRLEAGPVLALKDRRRYASRGGLKLEAALARFSLDPRGRVCLDAGASTGGFTDCLLQHGAVRVYAVDVGYGQLAWELRQDPRVVVMERTNVRRLGALALDPSPTLIVADLSFTSLCTVLPSLLALAARPCDMILLVKPQFELEREHLERGVVRDPVQRKRALAKVEERARGLGLGVRGAIESPVPGADGNVEWLLAVSSG